MSAQGAERLAPLRLPPAIELSLRSESLSLRRCRGCGWEGPAYLESCRRCPAVLGQPYGREIVVVAPELSSSDPPARICPVAVLALELSGEPYHAEALRVEARALLEQVLAALPETAALRRLPSGVLVALLAEGSLVESATAAARGAATIPASGRLEWRAGLAAGLVDGAEPWRAAVIGIGARLARAAQAGQTLAGYGIVRLLDHEWQFGAAGVLPRRKEDLVDGAVAFLGRKRPVPTPSALAPDRGDELIGRRGELAVLDRELARARAGEGPWCALVAPAGGGKSKLLRAWLGRLDRTDVSVIGAAASPFGQAPRALVDDLLGALETPLRPEVPAPHVLAVLAGALERAARERPLVILIDDLHWADADSLALLRALSALPLPGCLVVVALRSSFAASVPWLLERARRLELPPLDGGERARLLRRLLPDETAAPLRARLAAEGEGGNPLFLEQAAAYLQEAGPAASLPRSLHEAVLRRLELVRARIDRRELNRRPSPGELAEVERTIGEWLDRLETGDYDGRSALASYLSLLEQIDTGLVIAGSIAGVPQQRNRRLAAAIERFYSASFAERAEAIARLADRNPADASYAAARGGERAVAALRLEDAVGYLKLAEKLARGEERGRLLLALGDVLLARGLAKQAWRAYATAIRANPDETFRGRCERRLARAAIARGRLRPAAHLLERALPRLTVKERLVALCDLAYVEMLAGNRARAHAILAEVGRTPELAELRPLLCRTALRVALLREGSGVEQLASECASALVLERDALADLAALIDTTLLLRQAVPDRVDEALLAEATQAAQRLGNHAAETRLSLGPAGAVWQPVHPSV